MSVVLGIDAAWTSKQPSGLALIARNGSRFEVLRASASYSDFLGEATNNHSLDHDKVGRMLELSMRLAGRPIDLVAVDMPLSKVAIVGRRNSDNAISKTYGARHCSTHTPSSSRPGKVSDTLNKLFGEFGYPLAVVLPVTKALVEVYPHPALVELMKAPKRLPYKVDNTGTYWPQTNVAFRKSQLLSVWREIVHSLEKEISGTAASLPVIDESSPRRALKAFEDTLDAIICAWVGVKILSAQAIPYGDQESAIWVPV